MNWCFFTIYKYILMLSQKNGTSSHHQHIIQNLLQKYQFCSCYAEKL